MLVISFSDDNLFNTKHILAIWAPTFHLAPSLLGKPAPVYITAGERDGERRAFHLHVRHDRRPVRRGMLMIGSPFFCLGS